MKIHVSQIPPEGRQDRATYDPGALDMDRPDVHVEPFDVEAYLTKVEQEVVVQAQIRCPLQMTCGRCLERFASTVCLREVFSYEARPGETIDMTDDIRQEIILAFPMIPICRQACKGLCGVRGQNLNVAACPHRATEGAEHGASEA